MSTESFPIVADLSLPGGIPGMPTLVFSFIERIPASSAHKKRVLVDILNAVSGYEKMPPHRYEADTCLCNPTMNDRSISSFFEKR